MLKHANRNNFLEGASLHAVIAQFKFKAIIKFGSRIDVFLPLGSEIHVGLEEKVKGRETVLATLPQ